MVRGGVKGSGDGQSIKCFPCKHENVSSIPSTQLKGLGEGWWVWQHVSTTPALETQHRKVLAYLVSSQPMRDPVSKKENKNK